MTTAIQEIDVHVSEKDDFEITLRGKPENIIQVLVNGLPREALVQLNEAMSAELAKRRDEA